MKTLKKPLSILLSLIIILSALTIIPVISAGALDGIGYLDEDGEEQTANCVTALTSGSTALNAGWYAVTADTEINSRITCTGDVNLILCSDTTLTAHKGITVSGEDNSLTIYQQAEAENAETGKLIIDQVDSGYAGIGGSLYHTGDHITINGGTVTVTGGKNAAGIGGGYLGSGNVTINGGTVTATGGEYAVSLGGGVMGASGSSITLSWTRLSDSITTDGCYGTVTLKKAFLADQTVLPAGVLTDNNLIVDKTLVPAITYLDENGAEQRLTQAYTEITSSTTELSAGWYVVSEDVEIDDRITCTDDVNLILCNGTTLNAHNGIDVTEFQSLTIFQEKPTDGCETGKLIADCEPLSKCACIGGGGNGIIYDSGSITINGGIITANNTASGAGIGGGYLGNGKNITINGGIVTATGGDYAAGIGGGRFGAGNITINGGTVTATGSNTGAGIGGGRETPSASITNITINGGTVYATGSNNAAGIGGGYNGRGGNITISGGNVSATNVGNGFAGSDSSVTLKWTEETKHTMSVCASGCNVGVTLENGFKDGDGTIYAPGTYGGDTIADKTLTPAFFDVTWKNYDGTILKTDDDVDGGVLPTYNGATPVKPADEYHSYSFIGWTPEIVPLVEDTTYTAAFEPADGCFSGHSLSLDGDIGINFYILLSDAQLTRGAVVDFTWTVNGEEKTRSVTLTADDLTANGYKATCPVAVAEMTCDVNATLTIGGVQYETDTYSVKDYADTILSDDYKTKYLAANHTEEEYNKLATLVKAMLIYGAKAQIWFDCNPDDLADAGLEYTLTEVTPEMNSLSARDMESGLDAYGLKYEGSTIVYLSKTSLRHYYTITDQEKFDLVKDSVMFDAEPVDYHTKDGKIYFEVTNIGAADLDTPYPLQIGTNIYSYTVLDYVRECIKAKYTPYQTMLLVFATYWYNQAANDYFGR